MATKIEALQFEIKMLRDRAARQTDGMVKDLAELGEQLRGKNHMRVNPMDSGDFVRLLQDLATINAKERFLEELIEEEGK